jgi:hypothetical protein
MEGYGRDFSVAILNESECTTQLVEEIRFRYGINFDSALRRILARGYQIS